MAVEFHEGLSGAGKSYEAVVYHIIPALKERRSVVTNIRGMNAEKLAELTGEPLAMIELLLHNIEPAEQESESGEVQRCINEMCSATPDNALIVWDEIQDYFPSGNYKLPLNQQKFWTEHRHRGLDIVVMGQDRTDVHKLIRNRIRTVIYFLKLEAVGQPNRYKWEIYQKQRFGKFVKTGSGVREYESQYFGTYASHRRKEMRSKVYTTERTSLLGNSKGLVFGVPAAFAVAIFAVVHLVGFFSADSITPHSSVVQSAPPKLVNPPPEELEPQKPQSHTETPETVEPPKPEPIDYFDRMAQQHQLRAMGYIWSESTGESHGYIEFLDSSLHQKEKMLLSDVSAMGWDVSVQPYGLLFQKDGLKYLARPWPIDVFGRVDQKTAASLGGSSPQGSAAQAPGNPSAANSGYVTVVSDSSRDGRPLTPIGGSR